MARALLLCLALLPACRKDFDWPGRPPADAADAADAARAGDDARAADVPRLPAGLRVNVTAQCTPRHVLRGEPQINELGQLALQELQVDGLHGVLLPPDPARPDRYCDTVVDLGQGFVPTWINNRGWVVGWDWASRHALFSGPTRAGRQLIDLSLPPGPAGPHPTWVGARYDRTRRAFALCATYSRAFQVTEDGRVIGHATGCLCPEVEGTARCEDRGLFAVRWDLVYAPDEDTYRVAEIALLSPYVTHAPQTYMPVDSPRLLSDGGLLLGMDISARPAVLWPHEGKSELRVLSAPGEALGGDVMAAFPGGGALAPGLLLLGPYGGNGGAGLPSAWRVVGVDPPRTERLTLPHRANHTMTGASASGALLIGSDGGAGTLWQHAGGSAYRCSRVPEVAQLTGVSRSGHALAGAGAGAGEVRVFTGPFPLPAPPGDPSTCQDELR